MSDPKTPADPAENPATPASPTPPAPSATPAAPAEPEAPAKAETPATPAEDPTKAETPAAAETPATPAAPAPPVTPAASAEKPAEGEKSAEAEKPAEAEAPTEAAKPDAPVAAEKPTPAEAPAAAEKSDEKAEAVTADDAKTAENADDAKVGEAKVGETKADDAKAEAEKADDAKADEAKVDAAKADESAVDKSVDKEDTGEIPVVPPAPPSGTTPSETGGDESKPEKPAKAKRNPWLTVGTIAAVLLVLAGFGYFAGLGPMSRLSTTRDINVPDKLGGLNRITDIETRNQLQLDATRDTLSRVNDGKKTAVEAYGDLTGDKIYIVIALRGKIDLDKTLKADGATPDQVKKIGEATCVPTVENLMTRCYRISNTLTVIAQDASNKLNVEAVGPIANEAFNAMK